MCTPRLLQNAQVIHSCFSNCLCAANIGVALVFFPQKILLLSKNTENLWKQVYFPCSFSFLFILCVGKGSGAFLGGYVISLSTTRLSFRYFGIFSGVFGIIYFLINKVWLEGAISKRNEKGKDWIFPVILQFSFNAPTFYIFMFFQKGHKNQKIRNKKRKCFVTPLPKIVTKRVPWLKNNFKMLCFHTCVHTFLFYYCCYLFLINTSFL